MDEPAGIERKDAKARASIHLPGGIAPGDVILVDLSSAYVRNALKKKHLVLEDAPASEDPVEETTPDPA